MKVVNILKRYAPEFRDFLDSVLPDDKRWAFKKLPLFSGISLSLRDVIDVWLNTRYHHSGNSSRRGRYTRKEFHAFSKQYDPVVFEFYFLCAVNQAGISFLNILQCAESFLRGIATRGLEPSFPLCNAYQDESVERNTPGFTPNGNMPSQRVWRLRRRRHYAAFNQFLDLIECTDTDVAGFLAQCESFDEFAEHCGAVFDHTDDFKSVDKDSCTYFTGCGDNEVAIRRNRRCRRGLVAKRMDGVLVWEGKYVPVLRNQ